MPRLSLVPRSDLLIRSALSDFLLSCAAALRSPKTICFYTDRLGHFLAYLEAKGMTDPASLEARHVRAFLASEAKRVSPATVHASARAIKTWTRFME